MGRRQRKYEKEILAREAAEKKVAEDKAKKAKKAKLKAEQKARSQKQAEENPVGYTIAGLVVLGAIIWAVVSMCSSVGSSSESEASRSNAGSTSSSSNLASAAEAELLSSLGSSTFLGSGVDWAQHIVKITNKRDDLYVAIQVDRSSPLSDDLAQRTVRGVNNFLSSDLKKEIDWIIVTDGTGVVMEQKRATAGLMPAGR